MAGASIQMGAAQVEGLSEPKTWYDYVASAALTMASPAAKGALSFISPQTRSAATNWLREVGYSCLKKERPPIVRPGAEFLSYRLGGFLYLHLICQY